MAKTNIERHKQQRQWRYAEQARTVLYEVRIFTAETAENRAYPLPMLEGFISNSMLVFGLDCFLRATFQNRRVPIDNNNSTVNDFV